MRSAQSWFDISIGTTLQWYRRGHWFESRSTEQIIDLSARLWGITTEFVG